ncbi:MAG TPA: hypothetical protein DEB39_12240 [Planctomycetaceae bacterium]|nr:hypothetical protein [Planctomycetaceae bacterium]
MFFRHIPFLLLSAALLSGGCSKKPQPLVVYCSEIFVEPMERLGGHFQVMTGKKVILFQSDLPPDFEIRDREENAVSRPGQSGSSSTAVAPSTVVSSKDYVPAPEGIAPEILRLIKQAETPGYGDLWLCDSPRQADYMQKRGRVVGKTPLCNVTPVLLVPSGNPHRLLALSDIATQGKILGAMKWDRGGLGEVAEQLVKTWENDRGKPDELRILLYDTEWELVEAVRHGQVDAAIVWDAARRFNRPPNRRGGNRPGDGRSGEDTAGDASKTLPFELLEWNTGERIVVPVEILSLSSTVDYSLPPKMLHFLLSKKANEEFRAAGFKMN